MSDCPRADIRDLLPDWVHGTLAPEIRRAVDEHLAACAWCAAEVRVLRAARAAMNDTPAVDVERIAAAVHRGAATRVRTGTSWRFRPLAPVAAAALAASVIGVALLNGDRATRVREQRASAVAAADTPERSSARPSRGTSGAEPGARSELLVDGRIGELGEDDLRALLDRLERFDALLPANPDSLASTLGEGAI